MSIWDFIKRPTCVYSCFLYSSNRWDTQCLFTYFIHIICMNEDLHAKISWLQIGKIVFKMQNNISNLKKPFKSIQKLCDISASANMLSYIFIKLIHFYKYMFVIYLYITLHAGLKHNSHIKNTLNKHSNVYTFICSCKNISIMHWYN